jgi:hypothetical protein
LAAATVQAGLLFCGWFGFNVRPHHPSFFLSFFLLVSFLGFSTIFVLFLFLFLCSLVRVLHYTFFVRHAVVSFAVKRLFLLNLLLIARFPKARPKCVRVQTTQKHLVHTWTPMRYVEIAIATFHDVTHVQIQVHSLNIRGSSTRANAGGRTQAGSAMASGALSTSAVMSTQIGACVSGMVWLVLSSATTKGSGPSLIAILNGSVAGLAGITPASGYIDSQVSCGSPFAVVDCYFSLWKPLHKMLLRLRAEARTQI